jgi:hypothetical protein
MDRMILVEWYGNTSCGTTLAENKSGTINSERHFLTIARRYFTPYYQPLIKCVNQLRKMVFLNGNRWEGEDEQLYDKMR